MVSLSSVRESNSTLQARPPGWVAVFVGATSGIGAGTIKQLVRNSFSPKFYVIGRSEAKFSRQRKELEVLNPSAVIVFVQTEISLLRNVDAVCKEIASKEDYIDLLFMSAGSLAFGGPHYTIEGIDKCSSLSYYSRMRFASNLLPLLRRSSAPRILSVLAGGEERPILTHDLTLKHNYTLVNMVNHATTMHTLAFEHLAQSNPSISFIHAHPGWVHTDLVSNLFTPNRESSPPPWYSPIFVLLRCVAALFFTIFGISAEEAGERQAFHATSGRYTASKPSDDIRERQQELHYGPFNVYRLSWKGEVHSNNSILRTYRNDKLQERVWDVTVHTFEKALSR